MRSGSQVAQIRSVQSKSALEALGGEIEPELLEAGAE
jgi:hypothetical protein